MKKLLVLSALSAALLATAAPTKLATVQVADTTACVMAMTKLGELSGMAMVGPMLSPMIVKNPVTEFFGPMREGSSALLLVYLPEDKAAATNTLDGFDAEAALLYPVTRTKKQFLAAHPGAVETNGLIIAKGKESGKKYYSAFSKDGKWVASSEVAAFVMPALDEIAAAEKPLDGNVVRVSSAELKRLSAAMELCAKDKKLDSSDKLVVSAYQKILKEMESVEFGVRIDDRGLDVRGQVKAVKGSDLAKMGETTLGKNPLAFAAPEALSAEALAAGCPSKATLKEWESVRRILTKYGIKLDSVAIAEKDGIVSTTIDFVRLLKDTKSLFGDQKKALDVEGISKDFSTNATLTAVETLTKTQRSQVFFKETKATVSPSVRYAETLPELAGKPVCYASCASIYEIIRAVLPQVIEVFGEGDESLQMLKPMFAALPPAGKGGTANAAWREGDTLHGQARISKDEFKSLAAFYQIAMMSAQANAQADDDDDCDECDDDDDDEDDDEEVDED